MQIFDRHLFLWVLITPVSISLFIKASGDVIARYEAIVHHSKPRLSIRGGAIPNCHLQRNKISKCIYHRGIQRFFYRGKRDAGFVYLCDNLVIVASALW